MAKRLSSVERKRQIIIATLDIVSERGFGNITTAEIANRVGISEGAVFKHFSSKAEILQEVLFFIRTSLLTLAQNIISKEITADEKLKQILYNIFSFFTQYPGVPKVIFSEQLHLADQNLKGILVEHVKSYSQIIHNVIVEGREKGLFNKDCDPELATEAFLGFVQVNVFKWSISGHAWCLTDRADKIFNYFIRTLV